MDGLSTFEEDLVSNLILGAGMVAILALRDLCKRISHSDCGFDENGLMIKLPTWRPKKPDEREPEMDSIV